MSRPIIGTKVFRAIADPTRRELLDMLRRDERFAEDLFRPFSLSRGAMSQHLRILRIASLVAQRRIGRRRLYRLQPGRLREVSDWLTPFEKVR
jgi:DNA-binding transcriptional ArsR family regulator